jgi:hypothetical protein
MPWAAAAAIVGAGISASASMDAADAQSEAAKNANNLLAGQSAQSRNDLRPYNEAGQQAVMGLSRLSGNNGFGGPLTADQRAIQQQGLENLPGYQFTLQQGLRATQNSAAARGLGSSGAAEKGAAEYSTGLASSNFDQYWNQLLSLGNLGENAAAHTGAIGQGYAGLESGNINAAGAAKGAGILGAANGINNALNTGAGLYYGNQLTNGGGYGGFGNGQAAQNTPRFDMPGGRIG